MSKFKCLLFSFVAYLLSTAAFANTVVLDDLSWFDKRHLDKQVDTIDQLARSELGTQIRHNKDDLELLQRVIYKGLVERDDAMTQQAMGAVLGNVMVQDFGLEWKRYKDNEGVSRAICVPTTQHCLFPITMLSRRMSVGILPDVDKLYGEVEEMITPFLPKKSPYDVD